MKKSLVTLVLLAMIATSFVGLVDSTSDELDVSVSDNPVDVEAGDLPEMEQVEDRTDDIHEEGPISAPERDPRIEVFRDDPFPDPACQEEGEAWPQVGEDGAEKSIRTMLEDAPVKELDADPLPFSAYEPETGTWQVIEEEVDDPVRGAVNTSTLIYILDAPKKVHYGDEMELEGLLLEDNNSDGERNAGDLPIEREFVELRWAEGTDVYFREDLMTEWDNQELNMTPGRFSMPSKFLGNETNPITLNANVTSVAANGDRGVELSFVYKGVWTTNGAKFYNLTPEIYNTLWDKKIGEDDDGDADILQNNGIDDDNDGVVDDGRDGIPKVGTPEGVDEEILDGLDNDGDGKIDEDPHAFIARRGFEKRLYIQIWHKTETTVQVEGPDLVNVGEAFTVRGTIKDTSYEYTNMGAKTMRLFWDGKAVAETTATPSTGGYFSEYEFTYKVPLGESAGPHDVAVEFSPAYNITNNNYFDPSNATTTIHVRRPTMVLFDNIDPNYGVTWVYRGDSIYINGSIVDKLYFQMDRVIEGPRLSIDGVEFGNQYTFNAMWGDVMEPYHKSFPRRFIMDDNGTFSIEYELPASDTQNLGPVTVSVETTFDESRYHDPLIYYGNSKNTTQFRVRARTEVDVWMDQNDNEIDDSTEQDQWGNPLNTYITRKKFIGPDGKEREWNYARIRGRLKDLTLSTPGNPRGVGNEEIILFWGFGKNWQKRIPLVTDPDGEFKTDIPITASHALGPVPVRVTYSTDYFSTYYDSATYADTDGDPFSVVSFTELTINATTAVKGRNVELSGTLLDDRGVGIGNRSVNLYRLDFWDGNYNSLQSSGGLGNYIGSATTNSIGKFVFTDYVIGERMSVGDVWVVAQYKGSEEFPYGVGGVRYLPNDAYMPQIATPDKMVITSETAIDLDVVPDRLVRNGEARITGKLLESYRGVTDKTKGVSGQTITTYLKQGDEVFKMGVGRTKSDPNLPEFNGFFEIKTQNVPSKLKVGDVEVIVEFDPEIGSEGVALYQPSENITSAEVWSSTRVSEVFFKPEDDDLPPDRRYDLYEDRPGDWVFTWQILVGSTEVTSGDPVTYGTVWLNITMGAYTNTTRATTDIRGRVHFNFTSRFKDTATGNTFVITEDQDSSNLTIQIKFVGDDGFTESSKTYFCTYHRETPPEPVETNWALLFLILFILFLIVCVALFFFYKYIERRRRLKSLKKIIKKAADQLETGNPYSAVIFKAYQKMGAHLRRYGFMRRDADTFREFEDAVRTALPIDENSLDQFLDILEEARYSKHVIGSGHKDRAIKSLRGVESSLDNIILDEEAALRQMELADEEYVETEVKLSDSKEV
ncbi:MAG: DUF4129 domain-containing protein [Thermoplasmatota archaeon]